MGTAFGGARGRTDVPKIVDWYMDGKIQIDPMITHTLKLEDINKGFDLMHEGKRSAASWSTEGKATRRRPTGQRPEAGFNKGGKKMAEKLHPKIDNGVPKESASFAGGTLVCACTASRSR